jgi:DNA-binding response OmpR family regulator
VPPETTIQVALIDPTGRVRTQEMAVLRAAGMQVHLLTTMARPAAELAVDVVVADLRPADIRPGAVLRLAFEFHRPVVVVTVGSQVDARLAALRYGAVDHLVAPTEARELIERVRHAARRPSGRPDTAALQVDASARTIRLGTRSASLTPAELAVFEVLMAREGEVVSKAEIGEALPGNPRPNTVEVHVSALRRKLEVVGGPVIKTVHRRGYVCRVVASSRDERPGVRVADIVAQRDRLVRERDEHVRRRDEILQHAEHRRVEQARDRDADRRDPRR